MLSLIGWAHSQNNPRKLITATSGCTMLWKSLYSNTKCLVDLAKSCFHIYILVENSFSNFHRRLQYYCNTLCKISDGFVDNNALDKTDFASFQVIWSSDCSLILLQALGLISKWRLSFQVNSLRPRGNCRNFADDIFKYIFWNENVWILVKISLKFVPKGPINYIPPLVQIMAWGRAGNKPLIIWTNDG